MEDNRGRRRIGGALVDAQIGGKKKKKKKKKKKNVCSQSGNKKAI